MFRNFLVALLVGVSICLFASPASSQDEGEIAEEVMIEGTRFPVAFDSQEIPLFSVVEFFFRRISMIQDSPHAYNELLADIGIQPGSHADEYLKNVTDTAIEVLNERTVDGNLTGDAYMEHQYEMIGEKATKVGIIYRNLLLGLQEAGVPMDLVKQYCEETIRPSVKMFSTGPDNARYLETVAKFEDQLKDLQ